MSLSQQSISIIETIIKTSLRNKIKKYSPESNNMPFHYRLLGKDRMALFSFIQSLNTTFGTSIYEPVAVALAKNTFSDAQSQFKPGNQISEEAQKVIQNIMNNLSTGNNTNKIDEIENIRAVCTKGKMYLIRTVNADLYTKDKDGTIFLFDLKTTKPNVSNFKDFKRTLLEWCAIILAKNPQASIKTMIAIPYNPYEPAPYQRWTMKGMLDLKEELVVAEEFWGLLGGNGAYEELLNCFEKVGIELRPEIDNYFNEFRNA